MLLAGRICHLRVTLLGGMLASAHVTAAKATDAFTNGLGTGWLDYVS